MPLSSLVDFSFLPYSAAVLDSGGPLRPNLPLVPSFEERGFASYVFLGDSWQKICHTFQSFQLDWKRPERKSQKKPGESQPGIWKEGGHGISDS